MYGGYIGSLRTIHESTFIAAIANCLYPEHEMKTPDKTGDN